MLKRVLAEAVANLLASRQRSALALLGIVIGAAAVIAMLNVGAIARNETIRQFRQLGTDILMLRLDSDSGLGNFQLADVEALPGEVPMVTEVAPFVIGGGSVLHEGNVSNGSHLGVTADFASVARLRTQSGRFISNLDRYELYAVLGQGMAQQLSTPYAPVRVGSNLRIGRYVFTVIGILEPVLQSPMMPVDIDNTLFVSVPNVRRIMANPAMSMAVARIRPDAEAEAAVRQVERYFAPKIRDQRLSVLSARQLIAGMQNQMQLFTLLLGAVGAIALALGGVGVMNIMLVSIAERRREIGVRLAIGAEPGDIRTLFLAEAVILSVAGGIIGIFLGIGGAWFFAWLSGWEFVLSPSAVPLGAGVSAAVGIFFGFYPAVMASRLDPIEALRAE
ncbi:ABC transporter permease [Falsiroseomonas tokyonensis]|uniref:ABC transporter permease n=1 Tax=Falsiroseomonas tokyonensis TaxID=430521 RepID=A0ABV7C3U6_9PROT|nr:ABC transporter permease [Falsiroseomonas tokyonensis]MBU8541091.1 ABC transporter permease [Falsiroseomonas tokyonensis]